MELNKRNLKLTNDRKKDHDTITKLKLELVEQQRINNTLVNENGVLTAKLEKHAQAQRDGYLAVATNKDGYVTHIAEVLGYSAYTYLQDIPSGIDSKLYSKIPFIELKDGNLIINQKKYKSYKLLGGL